MQVIVQKYKSNHCSALNITLKQEPNERRMLADGISAQGKQP